MQDFGGGFHGDGGGFHNGGFNGGGESALTSAHAFHSVALPIACQNHGGFTACATAASSLALSAPVSCRVLQDLCEGTELTAQV